MNPDAEPLFIQVARFVEDLVVDGSLLPGQQAPSQNQLAQFHEINPATARKGLAMLADSGVLEKRRGLGMFVTDNARERILAQRRDAFAGQFVAPLIDEALHLGTTRAELHDLIDRVAESRGMYQ